MEKVGGMSIRELSKIAKERRAGALGYAEAMLIAYNKRNKAGLTWQRLYSGSSNKTTPLDENGEPKRKRNKKSLVDLGDKSECFSCRRLFDNTPNGQKKVIPN